MKSPIQIAMNSLNEPNNTMNATHISSPPAAPIPGHFHSAFKHLLGLVVAILMALGATAANAAVVVGSLGDAALVTPTSSGTTNAYTLSLAGNALQFLAAKDPQISFNYVLVRQSTNDFEVGARLVAGNFTATKLEAGEQLTTSSSVSISASPVVLGTVLFDSSASMWLPAGNTGFSRKFIGFKMRSSATDIWKYGWIELSYAIALNGRQTVTFHSAGYDTSGFPLPMGSTNSAAPVPTNDAFANSTLLTGTNVAVTGSSANASKQLGEPNHAGTSGGSSVWYRWTPTQGALVGIDTTGSGYDTLLGAYVATNSPASVSNLVAVASNDDAAGGLTSRVTFTALGGITYYIAVDGYAGQSGSVALNLNATNIPLPVITTNPVSATVQSGQPAQFIGSASSSTTGLALQWQRSVDGGAAWAWLSAADGVTGATSGTLVITNTTTAMSGHRFRLMASNFGSTVFSAAATLTVNPALAPPTITSASTATATVGSPFTFQVLASNGATNFIGIGLPSGLSLGDTSGTISGSPTVSGIFTVNLAATGPGGIGFGTLTLTINPAPNQAPTITSIQVSGSRTAPATLTVTVEVTDPDGGAPTVTFSTNSYLFATKNAAPYVFTVSNLTAAGHSLSIQASDAQGARSAILTTNVTVTNAPPQVGGISLKLADVVASPGAEFAVPVTLVSTNAIVNAIGTSIGFDPTVLAYTGSTSSQAGVTLNVNSNALAGRIGIVMGLPAGTSFNVGTQTVLTVNFRAAAGALGTTSLSFNNAPVAQELTDALANTLPTTFTAGTVAFSPPVVAPVITSSGTALAMTGNSFAYQISASNGATLFGASGLPAGLTVNATNGIVSGIAMTSGIYTITLSASNAGATGTATLVLSVFPLPPLISSPITATGTVGQNFTYQINASNGPTNYTAFGLPAGVTLNSANGLISGIPVTNGTFPVTIMAYNSPLGFDGKVVTLTVNPAPTPVITSPGTATATVGQPFSYLITATNNPVGYDVTGLPAGLSVNRTGGLISGIPTIPGTFSMTLDALGLQSTGHKLLTITVNPATPAPVITSALAATGTNGAAFTYQITASGSPTGYTATALPAGLSLNGAGGLISGSPLTNGVFTVAITATNATGQDTKALVITVQAPPNQSPSVAILSVSGSYIAPGNLTLTASASDSDGQVVRVEALLDGALQSPALTSPPFNFSFTGLTVGSHTFIIRAVDNQGAQSMLVSTNVSVTNLPPAGTVQFSSSTYAAAENSGSVTITVTRLGGSQGAATAGYATTDGPAKAGLDYVGVTNTLVWASGEAATKSFSVTLINDLLVEGAETFSVTLANPTGGITLGGITTTTVTIQDDDVANLPPVVTLGAVTGSRTAPASLILNATASDPESRLARVEFLLNDVKQGEVASPPFTFAFANLAAGTYTVGTRAVDDLGASATATVSVTVTNPPPSGLTLAYDQVSGSAGGTVLVPLRASGLANVASFQISSHWNPTVAVLEGIEQFGLANFGLGNFGTNQAGSGTVTISWDDPTGGGISLGDGATLFALRFRLIGSPGASTAVSIDGTPTSVELVDAQLRALNPALLPGRLTVISTVTVSGTVTFFGSTTGVSGTQVTASDGTNTTVTTDSSGSFSFLLPAGRNYVFTVTRTDEPNPTTGASTADILEIRRSILGISPLTGLAALAADVDGSGTITTVDILHLRRLILGSTNTLPAGLWRFVPAALVPPGFNPAAIPLNPQVSFTNLTSNNVASFVAIKLGDVNGSWSAGLAPQALPKQAATLNPPAVSFAATPSAVINSMVTVQISVTGLTNGTTAQFSMGWDPKVLQLLNSTNYGLPGLSAGNLGTSQVSLGKLGFSWDDPQAVGVSVPDGTVIFSLMFQVMPGSFGSTFVTFENLPVLKEVSTTAGLVSAAFLPANILLVPPASLLQFTQHPTGGSFTNGGQLILSARAANGPLGYQWQRNGIDLPGLTNADLLLSGLSRAHSGDYRVQISNALGSVFSSNASVRVMIPQRMLPPRVLGRNQVRLAFTDVDASAGTLTPEDAAHFEVQACTNLVLGVWTPLTNAVAITNGQLFVDVSILPEAPFRLFRVVER